MDQLGYLRAMSAEYIEELYQRYQSDPDSVDSSWKYFFDGLQLTLKESQANRSNGHTNGATNGKGNGSASPDVQFAAAGIDLSSEAKVAELITAYRERGRLLANLDPLKGAPESHPLLELSNFKLSQKDLSRTFTAGSLIGLGPAPLSEIIKRLKEIYCGSIGVEYTHIQDPVAREWLQNKMESSRNRENLTPELKKHILKRLIESKSFEHFLHTRYVAQKRFSIEGGEGLIPALDRMIEIAADLGANNVVMGMAHRGRLNVLLNVYGKLPQHIFTEFEEQYEKDQSAGHGDVKYHKGFSADIMTRNGKPVHLSLAHNPSHLEFVNPVVEGVARAKQRDLGDTERSQVIPILIHGDAAFAGQGVVYETLGFSQIKGFTTGGTIHVVIDNQIGFTALPTDSRSTTYSTDLAKMLEVPIFHVNGDDPEAIWYVSRICTEFRQKFKKDVFIEINCYRKYGHNEGDEPSFTQPVLYKKIKSHPSPDQIYEKRLVEENVTSAEETKSVRDEITQKLLKAQELTRTEKPKPFMSSYASKWKGLRGTTSQEEIFRTVDTKVRDETLNELAKKLFTVPDSFKMHKKLERFMAGRAQSVETGEGIDWGTGEALAFASLLAEGHTIRLSGQDVQRGTFTHRHAVLHDFENGDEYTPLEHLSNNQGDIIIRNSSLSEAGVLGFEYGWSLADPTALVIWEAQFGDFANGAQVIIDQFISSSETKWQRASGIVLLLPHGYEGQGPEHSSARLERFLQLCGEANMSVCNLTTPSQLFHALRRQLKREFRKPLVVMSPKSLLRHPMAISKLADFTDTGFNEVLDDPKVTDKSAVKRVVLCTGKVYYDLLAETEKNPTKDIAIVRVEQLYPFPEQRLLEVVGGYKNAKEFVWTQEEPQNQGAWSHLFQIWYGGYDTEFAKKIGDRKLTYVGRDIAATPAVGSHKQHVAKQLEIVATALKKA